MGLAAELYDFVLLHPDQFVADQAAVLHGLQRADGKNGLGKQAPNAHHILLWCLIWKHANFNSFLFV
jgi:hypothetical protein